MEDNIKPYSAEELNTRLDRVNSWIDNCDQKASILLAFAGALDEYLMSIRANTNGRVSISNFHSVTKIQKLQKKHSFPEILMSETVYKGFARANPNRTSVKEELWTVQNTDIRDINYPVYGGNIVWTFD